MQHVKKVFLIQRLSSRLSYQQIIESEHSLYSAIMLWLWENQWCIKCFSKLICNWHKNSLTALSAFMTAVLQTYGTSHCISKCVSSSQDVVIRLVWTSYE